jgi:hypothetical protein
MRSFISEHTVEFYLVPRFRQLLSVGYSHVLPFFFWKTREGSWRSRAEVFAGPVSVCAMFPRRPKIQELEITMKVNEEVSAMSTDLQRAGIPTFLGIPLVHSIAELATDFKCLWFSTDPIEGRHAEFEVVCNTEETRHSALDGPIENDWELCQRVKSRSKSRTWCEIADILHVIHGRMNEVDGYRYRYIYGPAYKPVYFVVW